MRRQVPLLKRLEAQGVSTTVVLLGDEGGLGAHLQGAGCDVARLATPMAPGVAALRHLPAAVGGLRALLRSCDADVLEGDEPLPALAVGLAARRRTRAVVVYRRHHSAGRTRLIVASRLAARLADRTIVSCEAMRRRAAEQDGTSPDRIDIASSGTADLEPPAAADRSVTRHALGITRQARVIGVVSRLRWEKGIDVLIRSLDLLGGIGEVHAVVVGAGPEESRLRRLAAGSRVPVHFLGHRQDVARWLSLADLIALPSRRESFGRVTLEAMAAARPVVASRVGGMAEAIADRETGLLVPPGDPAALAVALRTILADPGIARRMGAAARQRYEAGYTMDHMATAWREAWERAIAKERAPA